MKEGDTYYMLNYGDATEKVFSIFTSSDGIAWTAKGKIYDGTGLSNWVKMDRPKLLNETDGYKMYFQVKSNETGNPYYIYLATTTQTSLASIADSDEDNDFTLAGTTPVLSPSTTSTDWDGLRVMQPMVVKDGSNYYMWYVGYNSSDPAKIGFAFSSDGISWTKGHGNPILAGATKVWTPSVLKVGSTYHMWNQWDETPLTIQYISANAPIQFSTIQAAIDVASPGDTINVAKGTYDGNLIVYKEGLTIRSTDGAAQTIIDASKVDKSTYTNAQGNSINYSWAETNDPGLLRNGFDIWSDKVTIDGFTIINATFPDRYNRGIGILVGSIHTTYAGFIPWNLDEWRGIVPNPNEPTPTGVTLRNNVIDGASDGIYIWASSGNTIEYNEIRDTEPLGGAGIQVYEGGANNIIRYNTIENAVNAISICGAWPDVLLDVSNTQVVGNTITNSTVGIQFYNIAGAHVIAQGNDLQGNDTGIKVESVGDATVARAQFNNFIGNTTGVQVNTASGVFDATRNWWGAATGPYNATTNPGVTANMGDAVSSNVDYSPWLYQPQEEVVPTKKPSYAQSVILDNTGAYGWNTFSTPIFLDGSADTWAELYNLTSLAYSVAYRFDLATQNFVNLTTTDTYAINPGEGFFIKMNTAGSLPILYSTEDNLMPSSRPLTLDWNLIGLANMEDMDVSVALFSLAGDGQVVSPTGNVRPGAVLADGTIYVGEGYWAYMLHERTLVGFTTTPVNWMP
jgi:parallel beta-helix repeat protein